MNPELGQAAFRIAMFIIVVAVMLLLVVPRGTAEFAITVVTLVIGLAFVGVLAVLIRLSGR